MVMLLVAEGIRFLKVYGSASRRAANMIFSTAGAAVTHVSIIFILVTNPISLSAIVLKLIVIIRAGGLALVLAEQLLGLEADGSLHQVVR